MTALVPTEPQLCIGRIVGPDGLTPIGWRQARPRQPGGPVRLSCGHWSGQHSTGWTCARIDATAARIAYYARPWWSRYFRKAHA